MADDITEKTSDDEHGDRTLRRRGRDYHDEDSDSAINAKWIGNQIRVNNRTAQTLLKWIGPSLKWTVILLSIGGFVIMVCYGISMVVRR